MAWRLWYQPQLPHTMWGSLVAPQRGQVLRGGAERVQAEARRLQSEILACQHGRAKVVITQSVAEPLLTRVLHRGNWQDETGEVVPPAPPHFLPPFLKPEEGQRLTRLDLAKWLVSPENPLTARVFVNRLWKQFFGNARSSFGWKFQSSVKNGFGRQLYPPFIKNSSDPHYSKS